VIRRLPALRYLEALADRVDRPPVRRGLGIMLDDVVAALLALGLMHLGRALVDWVWAVFGQDHQARRKWSAVRRVAPVRLAPGLPLDYSLTRSDYVSKTMPATLNLTDAKARFSEVVERVSNGEEIIVTRMGRPVARISRYECAAANRRLGLFEGRIHLAEDFDEWPADIARQLGLTD
jgi:prevent-host-death family protein